MRRPPGRPGGGKAYFLPGGGGAAGPFGVPAKNSSDLVADALNAGGQAPGYEKKGFGGRPIELVYVDEAGGPTKVVTEYRNLVERQNVDMVIGVISSGDCLAVAPVAEELKKLTVLFDCATNRIFEEASYKYVFRTTTMATQENVAAARYIEVYLEGPETGYTVPLDQSRFIDAPSDAPELPVELR